jgi:hypothetical protein
MARSIYWIVGEVLLAAALPKLIYIVVSLLPEISTYPLTLGWSETSRYYNASLFFSQRIYGISTPPTVLHPSRYLMQAVPFLFPDSPLWLHRAWQVFLWLAAPLLTAIILVRRFFLETVGNLAADWRIACLSDDRAGLLSLARPVMLVLWGSGRVRRSLPPAGARASALISTVVLLVAQPGPASAASTGSCAGMLAPP